MDNLSGHENKAVRQAIRAAEARLSYPPPYSPDLNPIQQAFFKLKTLLRNENAWTIEQIGKSIAKLIRLIDREECLNYFQKAGVRVNLKQSCSDQHVQLRFPVEPEGPGGQIRLTDKNS